MITKDTDKDMDITTGRNDVIDTSDKPIYVHPQIALTKILPDVFENIGILIFMILIALTGAFVRFLKFDLRGYYLSAGNTAHDGLNKRFEPVYCRTHFIEDIPGELGGDGR